MSSYLENMKGTSFSLPTELCPEACNWLAFPMLHPRRQEILEYLGVPLLVGASHLIAS